MLQDLPLNQSLYMTPPYVNFFPHTIGKMWPYYKILVLLNEISLTG